MKSACLWLASSIRYVGGVMSPDTDLETILGAQEGRRPLATYGTEARENLCVGCVFLSI